MQIMGCFRDASIKEPFIRLIAIAANRRGCPRPPALSEQVSTLEYLSWSSTAWARQWVTGSYGGLKHALNGGRPRSACRIWRAQNRQKRPDLHHYAAGRGGAADILDRYSEADAGLSGFGSDRNRRAH